MVKALSVLVLPFVLCLAQVAGAQDTAAPAGDPEAGEIAVADSTPTSGPAIAPARSDGGIKDAGPHQRPMMASALMYIPFRFGLGIGVKLGFEIPIVPNGFIPKLNDSFSIEPSFSFAWNRYRGGRLIANDYDVDAIEYSPGVSALWSFHFSEKFRAYAAVHLGVTILSPYVSEGPDTELDSRVYFHGELAPGIVYAFSDKIAIRAELGWWSGAKFGVAMFF